MNEFMVSVERAVRPVQAGPKRKLRMREELLGHLTSIYEEELARLGDASAARAEAIRRFGDPLALTAELQQTVAWNDRIDARLNRAFGWRPGESALRYSARLACLVALVLLLWLAFALVVGGVKRPNDPTVPTSATFLRLFGGVLVVAAASIFALSLLAIRIRDSLHGAFGTPRSWRRVFLYATLSFLVLPAAWTTLGLLIPELGETAKDLMTTRSILLSAAAYLFVPLYMVAYARKAGPGEIRHVEWSSLDIGQ